MSENIRKCPKPSEIQKYPPKKKLNLFSITYLLIQKRGYGTKNLRNFSSEIRIFGEFSVSKKLDQNVHRDVVKLVTSVV
jgi:hypothetical protein